jgi:hypothetical protein
MLLHSKHVTRTLLTTLTVLLLGAVAYAQDSEMKLGRTITPAEVLALPRRDAAPSLTLQRALKIAERFAKRKRLDISSSYLFEAKWVSYPADPKNGEWHFWWVSTKHSKPDIQIAVALNRKPTLFIVYGAT